MPIKKLISCWLALSLSLQGLSCAALVRIEKTDESTERGGKPVNTQFLPPEIKESENEEIESFPSGFGILTPVPSLPANQKEYKKLKLTSRNSVAEIQKISREENLEIIVWPDTLILETASSSGRWYTGWVEPPIVLLGKKISRNSINPAEYEIVKLGVCGNAVKNLKIQISPVVEERTITRTIEKTLKSKEIFQDERTVIQTKKNYWPWLITTVALIGLGIVLWPEKEKKKEDPFCDPNGLPADR